MGSVIYQVTKFIQQAAFFATNSTYLCYGKFLIKINEHDKLSCKIFASAEMERGCQRICHQIETVKICILLLIISIRWRPLLGKI